MKGMNQKNLATPISWGTGGRGCIEIRFLRLLRRSDFSNPRENQELLPLNAADCAIVDLDDVQR